MRLNLRRDLFFLGVFVLFAIHLAIVSFTNNSSPYLIVRGISMEPTYHEGDVLLSSRTAPADIAVGDVIIFAVSPDDRARNKLPSVVAHRVISIDARGGMLQFQTKGDNTEIDPFVVSSDTVLGKSTKNLGPWALPFLFLTQSSTVLFILLPVAVFSTVLVVAGVRKRLSAAPAANREALVVTEPDTAVSQRSGKFVEIEEWCESVLEDFSPPIADDRERIEHGIAALRDRPKPQSGSDIYEIEEDLGRTA